MSDTAFVAVLLMFLWFLERFFYNPTFFKLIFSALILSVATYVRPVPLYFGFLLSPIFLLFPQKLPPLRRVGFAAAFVAIFCLSLIPWIARNAVAADYPAFSSAGDWNLYFVAVSAVEAKVHHRGKTEMMNDRRAVNNFEAYLELHPEQREWSEGRVVRFWHAEAKRSILLNLGTYSLIHLRACLMILLNPGVTEALRAVGLFPALTTALPQQLDKGFVHATGWLLRTYPIATILLPGMIAQLLVYYWLAAVGLSKVRWEIRLVFGLLAAYCVFVSAFAMTSTRFRAPFMPAVCICAGIAIAGRKQKRTSAIGRHHQEAEPGIFHRITTVNPG